MHVCVHVCFADDLPKKKPPALYKPTNPDGLAYLDFSVSTTGMLAGVQVSSALIPFPRTHTHTNSSHTHTRFPALFQKGVEQRWTNWRNRGNTNYPLCSLSLCVAHVSPLSLQMTHNAVGAFCRSVKLQCELYPSREVAICLDPYCGLGFVLWCLCRCVSLTPNPKQQ